MFQFKQFNIQQDLCAMKVGTDGVLLGAWATAKGKTVLDIGSGTGVISLMLAQRNLACIIDSIDIDKGAYLQTTQNANASPWVKRIKTHHTPLQNFKPKQQYDLIVTNPPYFIDSTKAPDSSRNIARHTDSLSFTDLIIGVKRLLNPTGIFAMILPIKEAHLFIEQAHSNGLYLVRKCSVQPNSVKEVKRVLMEFSCFESDQLKEEVLIIETEERHVYTKAYMELTKDFYLKF